MLVPIVITTRGRECGWDGDELWINGVPCSNRGVFYVELIRPNVFQCNLVYRVGLLAWGSTESSPLSVGIYPYCFEFADPYKIAGRV